MKISSINDLRINPNDSNWYTNGPKMVTGPDVFNLSSYDKSYVKLEISETGRQLAAEAITQIPAKYYGTAEINDSLNRILAGKGEELSDAVYTLIQSNLITDGSVTDDQRRPLLELGLTQAKFIAANYLTCDEAAEFWETINYIAASALTRTADPETGDITYQTPPEKPKGAPDDYVDIDELMKRFEPDTYKKLSKAIADGGDWCSILTGFAERVPQHPEWLDQYNRGTETIVKNLRDTEIANRFENADTSDISTFLKDMNDLIDNTQVTNKEFLRRNMTYFAHVLGYTV